MFVAGIGSGKSFAAEILECYSAHSLLCLRDPFTEYNLTKDKSIALINMGTSATQAKAVVFDGIKEMIRSSGFFSQFNPKILDGTIEFVSQKILLTSGNSKSTTPLGYNVYFAILDEAAFYLDNENRSVAQDIYESLQRRIVSRFGKDGLLIMISSPRYTEDFIMRKLEEAKELDESGNRINSHIFHMQLPTWKVHSPEKYDGMPPFYFNARNGNILTDPIAELEKSYKVNRLTDPNFDSSYDVREIPSEFLVSFRQNPDKAKRDFGATPSMTLAGFFPNPDIVIGSFDYSRTDPVI